jgi:hypothetical protein
MTFNFRGQGFFEFGLNIFERGGSRGGSEDTFHWLNDTIHVGGALDIFDGLDIGKGDGFHVAERDVGVGGVEDTQFLKGDLNSQGETPDAALVDLGRSIEDNEESEQ